VVVILSIELNSIPSKNGGVITAAEANVIGVSNERLRMLAWNMMLNEMTD
jgi:hypothetical protein